MTAAVISIADARVRRATGQPLYDRSEVVRIPIIAVCRSVEAPAGIIGRYARMSDSIIGRITGTFEVNGITFARVAVDLGFVRGVPLKELKLVDGPGPDGAA